MTTIAFQNNQEGDQFDYGHIAREGGLDPDSVNSINIWEPLPEINFVPDRIIITGSTLTPGEDIDAKLRQRSEIAAYTAMGMAEEGSQVIAICYGAQIIAQELWPDSIVHTGQWNVGRTVLKPVQDNPIIGRVGEDVPISVSYKVKLQGIPTKNILAVDSENNILAFKHGNIIGILGHPEMPKEIVERVIKSRKDDPRYQKINILTVDEETEVNSPPSTNILKRFFACEQ